jgi:hypothetical protein
MHEVNNKFSTQFGKGFGHNNQSLDWNDYQEDQKLV